MEAIQIKGADRWIYVEEPRISGGVSINHRNHRLKQLTLGRENPEKATSSDRLRTASTNDR